MDTSNHAKSVLIHLTMALLPLLWLPMYIYKCIVILIARLFYPELGKILSCSDFLLEEDLAGGKPPKCSILCSVELEGDLGCDELRELFSRNVLEAEIVARESFNWKGKGAKCEETYKTRYPEMKQCPASFMGYTFWRDVEAFSLKEHIYELEMEQSSSDVSLLHENVLNRPYLPNKSPWDLILVRNYQADPLKIDNPNKSGTVIIARFHHSMADAKSIMKLLVECLGQQTLNTAQPQPEPVRSYLGFILSFPFYFTQTVLGLAGPISQCWNHSWKIKSEEEAHHIVRLSPKLSLNDLKQVGKTWEGTTTSSVILAVISGAMREVDPEIGRVISAYVLPKPGHPSTLTNHAMAGALLLPSDIDSPLERLQTCNRVFRELKESDMGKHVEFSGTLVGTGFNPMRRNHVKASKALFGVPVGITNIAGERKGFSIGKVACSEVIYSVGSLDGTAGVMFCISSYKDHCRIAVISSGGVLTPSQLERMASGMLKELEILKEL